jgi:aspartyl/asparaginyl beta-hydroxylase (cupin superfamily)
MEPGTVVRPHVAIANDHVRLHLGIDVPEPDQTDLIVGGVRYGWM